MDPPLPDEPLPEAPSTEEELPLCEVACAVRDHAETLQGDIPSPNTASSHSNYTDHARSADSAGSSQQADKWIAVFDADSKEYYFFNTVTKATTWNNPRALDNTENPLTSTDAVLSHPSELPYHGKEELPTTIDTPVVTAPIISARFDGRTGKFVSSTSRRPEDVSRHARAERQLSRYVDSSLLHDSGISAKAVRRTVQYSKEEIQAFKQKQKLKKDSKRRAWLTDN